MKKVLILGLLIVSILLVSGGCEEEQKLDWEKPTCYSYSDGCNTCTSAYGSEGKLYQTLDGERRLSCIPERDPELGIGKNCSQEAPVGELTCLIIFK